MYTGKSNLSLILSTGRTGTKFLEQYINNTFENGFCLHEPKPSRRFKFLSILRDNGIISSQLIADYYQLKRKKYFEQHNNYIESNPFLFNCVNCLKLNFPNVKILHLVRHPKSYIKSHINHGFWSGRKRIVFKYLPYWDETKFFNKIDRNDPISLLIARWYIINTTIIKNTRNIPYLCLRFEDLFNDDIYIANHSVNQVRNFFGEDDLRVEENINWKGRCVNKSEKHLWKKYKFNHSHEKLLQDICGKLISKFSYLVTLFYVGLSIEF